MTLVMLWFLSAAAIPTALWWTGIALHKHGLKPLCIALISSSSLYLFLLILVFGYEFYLDYKLSTFDLNKDGFFSGSELTEAQSEAMKKVVHDTGRTFAPVTGGIVTLLYFFAIWLTGIFLQKIFHNKSKWRKRKAA